VSVSERRVAVVDSVAVVRDCAGYSGGRMKKGGELLRVASEAVAWRAHRAGVAAVTRGTGSGGKLAWSEQRRLDALSRYVWSKDAGCLKPTGSVL
jgi:hypothetical protein